MDLLLRIAVPALLFTATGAMLFDLMPLTRRHFHDWIDKVFLCLILGMGFYPIFFLVAQGLIGLRVTRGAIIGVFLTLALAANLLKEYRKRKGVLGKRDHRLPENLTEWLVNLAIFSALGVLFYYALELRLENTLQFPGVLLDADPYRHHIRTEALIQTGRITKWEPYIVGEVPIYELQGCYILAAVISLVSGFSAHDLWRYGAPALGALSVLTIYLLAKYTLSDFVRLDSDTRKRKKSAASEESFFKRDWGPTLVGLIAVGFLTASPIHILRTNIGFSEAFALPFFAPALLFYLFFMQDPRVEYAVLFGLLFTALSINNPIPAVYLVPLFFLHTSYHFLKTRDLRLIYGSLVSSALFFLTIMVWSRAFLGVPLSVGAWANSQAGTEGLLKAVQVHAGTLGRLKDCIQQFSKEVVRNMTLLQLILGACGSLAIVRRNRHWRLDVTNSFYLLFYFLYFALIFFIPLGIPSFTSKYYRNFLPASYAVALLSSYFLYESVLFIVEHRWARTTLLFGFFLTSVHYARQGQTWGGWILNCSEEEYHAADWIKAQTPPDAVLIGNWYTNDFMRSLTLREILLVDYPRPIVQYAMDRIPLNIPILKPDPGAMLNYVDRHPGSYYLITSQWGPAGNYEGIARFRKMVEFGTGKKTETSIYKILGP
jgi:hypothetical protein